jgi:2-deoxy-D-gluconate 3-dehydrogenase
VARAVAALGAIDILVNNAGIIRRRQPRLHRRGLGRVIDTNLKVPSSSARPLPGRRRRRRGGKIINTASMLSFQGGIRVPSYTASKSGVCRPDQADGQ